MGVFAEFERAIIQERVCAGLAKARAQGKRLGRPKVSASVERSILAARANGKGTGWNNTGNNEGVLARAISSAPSRSSGGMNARPGAL
jgi:DNA invertase Pin-like site-specific DNA recombinase